jgi:ABC-type Fe3+-hydroxamate transport system substrate-binding protein
LHLACRAAPLAAAFVFACGGAEGSGAAVDDAGRPVSLDGPAQRVVSLSPSTTELLFAIGAGDRVVGRTRWCEDPAEAIAVQSVGDGIDPSIELLVSRRPDLVVFYHSSQNAVAIAQLEGLGIATASVRLDRLDDLGRAARFLGGLTGDSARADSLSTALETEMATLQAVEATEPSKVLMLAWDTPPIVIGAGSFLSELVELAGGVNVFGDLSQPSAPVSIEAIAARAVDVVLLVGETQPDYLDRPEWNVVKAVREKRFVVVSGTEFSWPSYRSPAAVRTLRAALERLP